MLTQAIKCNKLIMNSYLLKYFFQGVLNMTEEKLMTIEEMAVYLRVKKRTIYDWLKKGKIPAIKTVGQWRFKRETVDAWLESDH